MLADDSGLEVDALGGAPGVHSARYAAEAPHLAGINTDDVANNARLLRELKKVPAEKRTARFVCVIAAAQDGQTVEVFRGQAEGMILDAPRGSNGFGYDPLFFFPQIGKTFAELSAEERLRQRSRGRVPEVSGVGRAGAERGVARDAGDPMVALRREKEGGIPAHAAGG